jgi:hypothetical protein
VTDKGDSRSAANPLQDIDADPRPFDANDPGRIFAAGTVEERQDIAATQAQDLDRMMRDPFRQIDGTPTASGIGQ